MCIESEADLIGLCRAGRVVRIALDEMRALSLTLIHVVPGKP